MLLDFDVSVNFLYAGFCRYEMVFDVRNYISW